MQFPLQIINKLSSSVLKQAKRPVAIMSTSLAFVCIALLAALHLAAAAPSLTTDAVGVIAPTAPNQKKKCTKFYNHYCNTFGAGYTSTLFPNVQQMADFSLDGQPDGVYLQNAWGQFDDFYPLLDTECHPKLGTFLCFSLFPFCEDYPEGPKIATPCKGLCEEITAPTSNCSMILKERGLDWAPHFNCSAGLNTTLGTPAYPVKNPDTTNCADQVQATWIPRSVPSPPAPPAPTTPEPPKCKLCEEGKK